MKTQLILGALLTVGMVGASMEGQVSDAVPFPTGLYVGVTSIGTTPIINFFAALSPDGQQLLTFSSQAMDGRLGRSNASLVCEKRHQVFECVGHQWTCSPLPITTVFGATGSCKLRYLTLNYSCNNASCDVITGPVAFVDAIIDPATYLPIPPTTPPVNATVKLTKVNH